LLTQMGEVVAMSRVPSTDIDWRRAFVRSGVRFVERPATLDLSLETPRMRCVAQTLPSRAGFSSGSTWPAQRTVVRRNNTRSLLFSPRDSTSRPSDDQSKLLVTALPVKVVNR